MAEMSANCEVQEKLFRGKNSENEGGIFRFHFSI